jgi:hypothetical protein
MEDIWGDKGKPSLMCIKQNYAAFVILYLILFVCWAATIKIHDGSNCSTYY